MGKKAKCPPKLLILPLLLQKLLLLQLLLLYAS